MGALRIREHHSLVDLWRLYVRYGLCEVWIRKAYCTRSRKEAWQTDTRIGLRDNICGPNFGPIHTLQHGKKRRDNFPHHSKYPRVIWIGTWGYGTQDRIIPHVDGFRRHLFDKLPVFNIDGAQSSRSGSRAKDRWCGDILDAVVFGISSYGCSFRFTVALHYLQSLPS